SIKDIEMVSARLLVTTLLSAALTSAQYFNSSSSISSFSSSSLSSEVSSSSSAGNSSSIVPSSSSSELPPSSSSSTPEETPFITGSFVDGVLQWEIFVPGSLGPWTQVSIAVSGQDYTVESVDVLVDGEGTQADVATDGPSISASSGEQAPIGSYLSFLYRASRNSNARQFTTDAILTITTPDAVKLVRRAVITYEFSSTITVPDDASSLSSSSVTSGTTVPTSSGSTSEEVTTTIWGTSVVTTTKEGTVTSYTTYCPIATETCVLSTVTVSVESCPGVTKCHVGTTTAPGGGEHTFTYTESVVTITKGPGHGPGGEETTKVPGAPVTTITLGGESGKPTTGGAVKTSTNEEGSTVVVVYETSKVHGGEGSTGAPTGAPTGGSTTPAISTFEAAGHKLASGLGLLLPAFVFLF
ncbi:hypothetical protein QLS91_17400, partial [Flavobacterium sp. LB2P84]